MQDNQEALVTVEVLRIQLVEEITLLINEYDRVYKKLEILYEQLMGSPDE